VHDKSRSDVLQALDTILQGEVARLIEELHQSNASPGEVLNEANWNIRKKELVHSMQEKKNRQAVQRLIRDLDAAKKSGPPIEIT
jgi:Mg/Co/Ni transporter MgtE